LIRRISGDPRDQPKNTDDRDDNDEKDVLIEVHQLGVVPPPAGLSVPAIDSRIDVSACTFFIRT
jgi:hypothetical protein